MSKEANDRIRAMIKARDAAFLSLDEQRIRGFYRKYNGKEMPQEPTLFWMIVHKVRTAATSLPMEARSVSKRWLLERGSEPMDDGDVPV